MSWSRLAPVGLLLLCVLFHGPAVRGEFVYDDRWTVLANPVVRDPGNLAHLLGPGFARADIPDAGRPVMLASAIVDWWLWGRWAPGHHLQSLLLHVAVTLLSFLGLRRLSGSTGLAMAAAALHACHPLHVEAVAAINYREDLLATVLLLAALFAMEAARMRARGAAVALRSLALVSATLACLAKESGYVGPLLLVVLDLIRSQPPGARRSERMQRVTDPLLLGIGAALAFGWRWWVLGAAGVVSRTAELPAARADRSTTVLQGAESFLQGLGQFLLPGRFSPEYVAGAPGWLGLTAAGALVFAAVAALRFHRRAPLLAGGFLWAAAAYLPHLGLVPLTNVRADRYFYLPGLGLAAMVIGAAAVLLASRPALLRLQALGLPLVAVASAVVVLLLGGRTLAQGRIWRDERSLFEAAVARAPAAPRAWRGLAVANLHQGRTLAALDAVDRALALDEDAHARELRGLILMRQGDLAPARGELERALSLASPSHRPRVLNNLGFVELELGQQGPALERFAESRQLAPAFDRPWLNAVRALDELGHGTQADALLQQLTANIPGSIDGWVQLGARLQSRGQREDALGAYQRALALSGGDLAIATRIQRLQAQQ